MPPPPHENIGINYQTAFRTKESPDAHGGEQTIDKIVVVEEFTLCIDIPSFADAGFCFYRFFRHRPN